MARGLRRVGGAVRVRPADPLPGLYFCGQFVSPAGMLREIGLEAHRIAASIGARAACRRTRRRPRACWVAPPPLAMLAAAAREERSAMSTDVAAPTPDAERSELFSTGYEIFVGALSVLSLVNIVLITVLRDPVDRAPSSTCSTLLLSADLPLDFTARISRATDKSGYFWQRFGWADLLASLPLPQIKILRVFRLVRVVRLMRHYGARRKVAELLRDRAANALLTLLLIGILVMEFGSLAILHVEQDAPGANITSASDSALVRHRDDVDGGLRRPVPRHERTAVSSAPASSSSASPSSGR